MVYKILLFFNENHLCISNITVFSKPEYSNLKKVTFVNADNLMKSL